MPLIDQVLDRLDFRDLLSSFIKNSRYAQALEVLIKNVLMGSVALYRVQDWASQYDPERVSREKVGDDLLGRALEKLFAADRATLLTEITLKMIKKYQVDISEIHNDSTTVMFHGAYKDQSPKAASLKRGHSKDHRPDLKQLVYNMSITRDGAVPIHFKCHDGNRTDDSIHIETWLTLRGILGRSDFLYVADSKLCTSKNMTKIDREGGTFVTIVPETRLETKEFAKACFESEVRWSLLTKRPSVRCKRKYDVFQVAEGLHQLSEGFRIFWYRSSEKRKRDEDSRSERIELSIDKLNDLKTSRRRGPKTEKSLLKAAERILSRYKTGDWINLEVRIEKKDEYKKTSSGKPGPNATYRRNVKEVPCLVITKNYETIAWAQAKDGIFPLTTNSGLGAKETLEAYKYQPYLEKRFSWIKSDYDISPAFLKKTDRIEALMFIFYLADLVAAIIQRELRKNMVDQQIQSIKTLPEQRPSKTPTWEQIKRVFDNRSKYVLSDGGSPVKSFFDELTPVQKQVLDLLNISTSQYWGKMIS